MVSRSQSQITPRLLTDEQARAYLGGCNPAAVVPPTRIGRNVRWDRLAIDAHLDEMGGLPSSAVEQQTPEQALAEWQSSHGADARRS